MRRISMLFVVFWIAGGIASATLFSTIRGIVHDPQHRPVQDITVTLKAKDSDFTQTVQTDAEGEFHFDAVPLGEYRITISKAGFNTEEKTITVLSGTDPILHFELQIASQNQSVTVSAEAAPAQTESVTPTTFVDRKMIQETPGASRTNSLAIITDYVPGAYLVHDQLHVRGGHQVSWLLDGVPIPNTNIASNLGPQIDPKDMDAVEMQRGSYAADYGDRTFGVFNVAPRTGFDRNNEIEVVLSAGNFYMTDDQVNLGGHTQRFAYYASVNGNRSSLGLQTPSAAVIHDAENGYGAFGSLIYNKDSQNQLRFVAQLRSDYFQVPFDSNDPSIEAGTFLHDANKEGDAFATFSWVHTFGPGLVWTVSPFYHFNRADYVSSPTDTPSASTQLRASYYEGGQSTLIWVKERNNLRAGIYGFAQQDSQLFGLAFNDGSGTLPLHSQENTSGSLIALYAEDQFRATNWLTLNAGLRQTFFSGITNESASSPRFGVQLRIPKLNWVFRAFYGQFYQAPPLATVSGPLLDAVNAANLSFIPLQGERDEENQFGVTIPFKGWTLDADTYKTRSSNFFDHNNLNNSDIFFPVTIQGALLQAWELTLHSPRLFHRGQVYVTYSNQVAEARGCITGGLIPPCTHQPFDYFLLDHDQLNTLHVGGNVNLPWGSYASTDVYYGSGFTDGDAQPGGPTHLPGHTTFDLTLGKNFGERFSLSLNGLNLANRRILLDNSLTFGGTHWMNRREIFFQFRYRFHY